MTNPNRLCAICGHVETVHYTYIRNGEEVGICKQCDPATGVFAQAGGNPDIAVLADDDYMDRVDFAEHDFVAAGAE